MSTAKYPNRDALREANDIYLDAMRPFVVHHLKQVQGETVEHLIEETLADKQADKFWQILDETGDVKSAIDFSYFPLIIRDHWHHVFAQRFNKDMIVQSMLWLIRDGRNSCEHRGTKDLDSEFVRINLFHIADVLGKISRPDKQREVESVRDKLFSDDTAERLADAERHLKTVKAENAKYEKSLAESEKNLETAESEKNECEKDNTVLSNQVDEKERGLKKLSKQLKRAKTEKDNSKKNLAGTKKRLVKSEAAKADYKARLDVTSKELKETKAELKKSEACLTVELNKLSAAQAEKSAFEEHLAAMRNLLTTAMIGSKEVQAVFPPLGTDSAVRILDRRGTDKPNYLLGLLEQKQPTIIYVQSEEKINLLLKLVGSENADVIGKHDEQTSDAQEMEILEKLENGELIAVVSNAMFSALTSRHCVEHFVFCHLVPGLDEFFKQCKPAFMSEKNAYLHLIYESKENIEELAETYPSEEALRTLYQKFKDHTPTERKYINPKNLYNKLCQESELNMTKLGIETGFSIFEELGFLEQNEEGIRRLSTTRTELEESKTYCRGDKLKKETVNCPDFQYKQSIEQIWEKIQKALHVEDEQVVPANNIHKISSEIPEVEDDMEPTIVKEQNKATLPTADVWPQRGMSAFNVLRQRAANTSDDFQIRESGETLSSSLVEGKSENYLSKYNLAMEFVQEHGVSAFEQGIAQLVEDREDPDYNFTIDERIMLDVFQDALQDFQTKSEQSREVAKIDSMVDDTAAEESHTPKPSALMLK